MIGAAIADLHLGFRAFPDVREGRNTREKDTEEAYFHAVEVIIKRQPELVTMAGDIFHHPRVSDYAKAAFLGGLRALLKETEAHIIILQGNHDAGRTADVLTPIMLAEGWDSRVHIVTTPKRIVLDTGEESVAVACFPFVARGEGKAYKITPDPEADTNILLVHAAVKGDAQGDKLPYFYGSEDQALDVGKLATEWDVVACGDYHEFTRLHPDRLAFYSGSLERTSSNIWAEKDPKGVVFYDTEVGNLWFDEIPNRDMRDYTMEFFYEDAHMAPTAENLNSCLQTLVLLDILQDAIVRLKVEDFPKTEREHIDWQLVRQIKGFCCHFYLDLRYATADTADLGDRREKKAISLADEALAFLKEDPTDVRDLFISFLDLEADVEDAEEVAHA